MKKYLILLLMLCFNLNSIKAFNLEENSGENGSRQYTVKSGDTWYAVARKAGISFSELRMANKNADKVLKPGQVINIPEKAKASDNRHKKNFTNDKKKSLRTTHKVESGETIYRIAKKYGVNPNEIKQWNHLSGSNIKPGQVLIVAAPQTASVEKDITPTTVESSKTETEKAKPVTVEAKKTDDNKPKTKGDDHPLSGYVFSSNRQQITEQGTASSIESEEVNPGKYYALHRTAPVGTIIKVTNRMNGQSVFVKVVGTLPETGDNDGLLIKISKSGADKLGVLDQHFQVELLYGVPAK